MSKVYVLCILTILPVLSPQTLVNINQSKTSQNIEEFLLKFQRKKGKNLFWTFESRHPNLLDGVFEYIVYDKVHDKAGWLVCLLQCFPT